MAKKKNCNACIFCLSTMYKNPSISLHAFPKDKSRRSLWLAACGLTEEDYKPSRKLCSRHFDRDCFKTWTTLRMLKPNSVPTKFNKRIKEFFISTSSHKMPKMSSREVPELLTYHVDKQDVTTAQFETVSNCEMETSQIYDTPEQKSLKYYAGDATTPDLATPRRAKLNFIETSPKYKIIEPQKEIKYLYLKVNNLHRRLASMTELINNFKKKSSN